NALRCPPAPTRRPPPPRATSHDHDRVGTVANFCEVGRQRIAVPPETLLYGESYSLRGRQTEGTTTEMAQHQNHTTARFNGVKIFSATMAQERENLGEKVTGWIREHPQCQIVDTIVTQSSDEAFHCLAITIFWWEDK